MILASTPLSNWMYKHFGVVDYVVHGGALNDPGNIDQQWPGFFATAAGLVRLSGRSPLTYSNWAQLFFEAFSALTIFAIARRLPLRNPAVPYVAVLLFVTADWEGQSDYAPQTLTFLLALMFQFFLLPMLEPADCDGPSCVDGGATPAVGDSRGGQTSAFGRATRVGGLIGIFAAITVTHQLWPYFVFIGIFALVGFGYSTPANSSSIAKRHDCSVSPAASHRNRAESCIDRLELLQCRGFTRPLEYDTPASPGESPERGRSVWESGVQLLSVWFLTADDWEISLYLSS